jgi:hypothetical protein
MQKEGLYINCWRTLAEGQLGWGDSSEWSDQDFEKLSARIFGKTGTMLSITTLKRLWGRVKYDSSPNAATLNVMAKFIDFDDWRGFKKHINAEQASGTTPAPDVNSRKKTYLPLVLTAILIVVILGVTISRSIKPKSTEKIRTNAAVKFESEKVADGLPNSVVFNYDASGLGVDSVMLQQSWDPSRNEEISAQGKEHTSIYYYPGYFTAKLIVNGQVKKESPVFIKTKGWAGIIDKYPTPTYLSAADMHLAGALGITGKTLAQKNGSPVFNDQWVSFSNVREFGGLNGGDFALETTLRNTSKPDESSCRRIIIYILGKSNAMVIPLADKGCISALNMYTSSEWINGKDRNLSAFGCDFNQFQDFKCEVQDMNLNIYLNNKQIFTAPITQTIGDIVGLSIRFEGSGEIRNLKLGNKNKTFLEEKF